MNSLNIYSEHEILSRFTESIGHPMKAMHIHDDYEIFMSMIDDVRFFVEDSIYQLNRGDVILFTNRDLHKVSVPDDRLYRRWVITFSPSALCREFRGGEELLSCFARREYRVFHLTKEEQARFVGYAESLAGDMPPVARWLNLGQLLYLLCEAGKRLPQILPGSQSSALHHIREVIRYIDEHFAEEISLDQLGGLCHLDKSYLCRLFKQETGFRIHDYLVYRRLSHSLSLLQDGEAVGTAARLSGFGSDTFFITVFKQNLGMTPYQYAKRARSGLLHP